MLQYESFFSIFLVFGIYTRICVDILTSDRNVFNRSSLGVGNGKERINLVTDRSAPKSYKVEPHFTDTA